MKQLLMTACLVSPSLLWAQGNSYTLSGNLAGVKAPAKAYLGYRVDGTPKMDSALIQNGMFTFKGTIDAAMPATVFVDKLGTGFSRTRPISAKGIYLESGTITLTSPDSLENAVASGTPLNVDSQKLTTMLKPVSEKMAQFMNEYRSATPEQQKSKEYGQSMEKKYEAIEADQKKVKAQLTN